MEIDNCHVVIIVVAAIVLIAYNVPSNKEININEYMHTDEYNAGYYDHVHGDDVVYNKLGGANDSKEQSQEYYQYKSGYRAYDEAQSYNSVLDNRMNGKSENGPHVNIYAGRIFLVCCILFIIVWSLKKQYDN